MSDSFDPYLAWLNIPSGPRPPDHYALLGIKQFEDSSDVILQAAEAQLAKIRTVRPGENVRDWGQLLDELDGVKGCLLDPQRKSVYDQELGRAADPAPASAPLLRSTRRGTSFARYESYGDTIGGAWSGANGVASVRAWSPASETGRLGRAADPQTASRGGRTTQP